MGDDTDAPHETQDRPEANDTGTPRQAPAAAAAQAPPAWERELLAHIALEGLREQRRARRWGIFFKLLFAAYLIGFFAWFVASSGRDGFGAGMGMGKPHTGLIDISGVIAADEQASADNVIAGLRDAFESEDVRGIILRINSPGGSPVEASYINEEIRRLREEHPEKSIYTVITDICASGGYYIAAATEQIYANQASIVGSIGVVLSSFGFVDALDKLGVERRLLTAGDNKGLLDPFSPQRPEEVEHMQELLDTVHRQFIEVVREGRGDLLDEDDAELFSGLVWTGEQGVELGLVDDLATTYEVARDVIGAEEIVHYTSDRRPLLLELLDASMQSLLRRLQFPGVTAPHFGG